MKKKKVSKKTDLVTKSSIIPSKEDAALLEYIKTDILRTQLKTALSVTKELTLLYWRIGKELSERNQSERWGTKVVEKLACDLQKMLPGVAGFSRTNIYRMMAFYEAYSNCPTVVGQSGNDVVLK